MQATIDPQSPSGNPFLTQITQGIMLGSVLAIPVALWAYAQAQPQSIAVDQTVTQPAKSAKRLPGKKPMRVAKDAQTIPASQMHVRIDDGRRSQPSVVETDN